MADPEISSTSESLPVGVVLNPVDMLERLKRVYQGNRAHTALLNTQYSLGFLFGDKKMQEYLRRGKPRDYKKALNRLIKKAPPNIKAELDREVNEESKTSRESSMSTSNSNDLDLRDLHRQQAAWKQEYLGPVATVFASVVTQAEKSFKVSDYAKLMAVVQSSGAGKSRLIDEYSKTRVGVIYTFRVGAQSGYPPGDVEITELLVSSADGTGMDQRSMEHATVIALLGVTAQFGQFALFPPFNVVTNFCSAVIKLFLKQGEKTRRRFPAYFRDYMAPSITKNPDPVEQEDLLSRRLAATRSDERIRFCEGVVEKVQRKVEEFRNSTSWKAIFDKGRKKKQVRSPLLDALN